nr:unnamed protein product [Callosobruchus chinensis]CAH7757812.1 unnamed protein product [Callosobruchus chinensis]CAH7757861.1 unnamed protein product [Callosobruchus chinensis]CAH7760671.1 unnamed protein product [Callosobruchus chinensis]
MQSKAGGSRNRFQKVV